MADNRLDDGKSQHSSVWRVMAENLNPDDWIIAALKTLAKHGFMMVKADVLAKALGVSRGSFYWHFQNVEAFHLAVMQRWQNLATDAIIRQVESAAIGSERLRLLIRLAFTADSGLEAGMRTWAIYYEPARACVEKVDASRLGYLEQLLATANFSKSRARTRSRIIYWTYLGSVLSGQNVSEEEFEHLIGELIA